MPYKEREISKKYYSIGEVAEKLDLNTSLIRFWESEFEILNPKKNKKGLRKYTQKDIEIIEKIYHLLKKQGFTIDGAKKAFKRNGRLFVGRSTHSNRFRHGYQTKFLGNFRYRTCLSNLHQGRK